MGTMREDQKRVRLRSAFCEKLKKLVSVLKARRSFSARAVVLIVKSLHPQHQPPLEKH